MNKNKVGLSVAIAIALLAGGARAQTEPATAAAPAGAPPRGDRRRGCAGRARRRGCSVEPAASAGGGSAGERHGGSGRARRGCLGLASQALRFRRNQRHVRHDAELRPASNNVLLARPGS